MTKRIVLTPGGHLAFVDDAHEDSDPAGARSKSSTPVASLDPNVIAELDEAFTCSSAAGLLRLAAPDVPNDVPVEWGFWRGFARRLFEELRNLGEPSQVSWQRLPRPADVVFEDQIASAPPQRGIEYLSVKVLRSLWADLHALILERSSAYSGGPDAYARHLNPHWHTFGRVTFHLAENKRDTKRPFAFLATFAHRVSSKATLQHLPLAEAVKQFAGENHQEKLRTLLQPVQRAAEKSEFVKELLQSRALFQPQAWDTTRAYRFLSAVTLMQEAGVVVRLPNWWNPRQPPRPQVNVRIGEQTVGPTATDTMLDFHVSLSLDGEPLTDAERKQILAANAGLLLLRGKWVEVNRKQLGEVLEHWQGIAAAHQEGLSFVEGLRLLADTSTDGRSAIDDQTHGWTRVITGDWMRETLAKIRDPSSVNECQPGQGLHATLRHYQDVGVRWLWLMMRLKLGACLADDMGLGKTIQVIALLLNLQRARQDSRRANSASGPSLLVVPASLIGNWKQEFERFAPTLRVFYAHRSETPAETLERIEKSPRAQLRGFDVVMTTYSLARTSSWLTNVSWSLLVLDEAQAIKNSGSAQTRAIKKLPSAGRIVLTGTPVENNLGDLWSLFDFCSPGLLGSASEFKKFIKGLGEGESPRGFGPIRQLVRPYILRRLKTDPSVAPDLPEKTEMRIDCGLSKRQAVLYEQTVEAFSKRLEDAEGIARRGLVLSVMMQLKQICNHPSQFLNDGAYAATDSGKFRRLAQICETIVERQERALVFTQFQSLTAPLAEYLAQLFSRPGLVLHGGTPVGKRKQLVKQFQSDDGPPFFVISLKAGGFGLNLTAASHVIHFDRWWNPAVENQATDRAFRIGQKNNVLVHKFTCRGTVEERIDQMIRQKQQLSDDILAAGEETLVTEMTDEQLREFVTLDWKRATEE